MGVVVGTLTIDLKANTASFSRSMDKMSELSAKTATDIKRSLDRVAAVGVAMAGTIAAGTVAAVSGAIDAATQLEYVAQAAGTTAEEFSKLTYGARLDEIETNQLAKSMERLSKNSFLAQNGNLQAERIFKRLGVSATDASGHLKDAGVLMEQIAPWFAKHADGAGKTAIAYGLMGKSGAVMIPFLDELGAHQKEIDDNAQEFGLILSNKTAAGAAEAYKTMILLRSVLKGMGFTVLSAALPALNELLHKVVQLGRDMNTTGLARAFGEHLVSAARILGNTLEFAERHAHALKVALEALAAVQLGKIALPIIADLASGGLASAGKGIDRFTLGLLGMERVLPSLKKIGSVAGGVAKRPATYFAAAKGASFAEVAAVGASTGFGGISKSLTALRALSTSTFASIAKSFTSLKALTAESIFTSLLTGLKAIPAALSGIVTWAMNAAKALSLAALSNPWLLAAAAVIALGVALYKFRNSTFSLKGTTYELRDVWSAAWIAMGKATHWLGGEFGKLIDWMKKVWSGFTDWISKLGISRFFKKDFDSALSWAHGMLGKLTPQWAINDLNEAKRRRENAAKPPKPLELVPDLPKLSAPDTSGLSTHPDYYADEIRKLNQAVSAQKAYLAVIDASPEKIEAVKSAEMAQTAILGVNKELLDEGMPALSARQRAIILQKTATEENIKAMVDYGRELVNEQHSSALAIQQSRAMAVANLQGAAAIRAASVSNEVLALTYRRTAEQLRTMAPEIAKLRALLSEKSSADLVASTNKEIDGLHDELAELKLVSSAMLESVDARRQAALASKLYSLNQDIREAETPEERTALEAKRQALVNLTAAQNQQADSQAGLELLSPVEQYARQNDELQHAVEGLKALQGGTLSYGEQLEVAAKKQDDFNKATDDATSLILQEGSAMDGIKAVFLEMQKQAQTTADLIYQAFNSAFAKISAGLTAVITSPNAWKRREALNQFSTMFANLGKQVMSSTITKGLHQGVGAIGSLLGVNINSLGLSGKPDGTQSNPWYVRLVDRLAGPGSPAAGMLGALGIHRHSGSVASAPVAAAAVHLGISPAPAEAAMDGSTPGDAIWVRVASASGQPLYGIGAGRAGVTLQPAPGAAGSPLGRIMGAASMRAPGEASSAARASIGTMQQIGQAALNRVAPSIAPIGNALPSLGELPRSRSVTPAAAPLVPMLHYRGFGPVPADHEDVIDDTLSPQNPAGVSELLLKSSPVTPLSLPSLASSDAGLGAGAVPSGGGEGSLLGAFGDMLTRIASTFGSVFSRLGGGAASMVEQAQGAGAAGGLGGFFSSIGGGLLGVLGLSDGGSVEGPGTATSDSIPARLSRGEFVVRAAPAAKHISLLQHINSDRPMPRFASGGLVAMASPAAAYSMDSEGMRPAIGTMISSSIAGASSQSFGGDQYHFAIDARGASDPAQIEAAVHRGLRNFGPQMIAASIALGRDRQSRQPNLGR